MSKNFKKSIKKCLTKYGGRSILYIEGKERQASPTPTEYIENFISNCPHEGDGKEEENERSKKFFKLP